jgi:hypothetical protein
MVAGHFGFAAIVKSRERETPLGMLMLATQWLDVIFVPLFVAGIETIVPASGTSGGYGNVIIYADYTHSLVGSFILSVILGVIAALIWGKRSGVVIGAVSFSHWLIDLLVHRHDMPILPGNAQHLPRLGFGLWRYPTLSIAMEAALVIVGAYLYWRAAVDVSTQARRSLTLAHVAGSLVLIFGLLVLVLGVMGL